MNAQQLRIIWVAMVMSIIVYAVLAFAMVPVSSEPFEAAFSDRVIALLHLLGIMMLVMSFVMPMLLLRAPGAERARLAMIVRWALTESPAIFGLVSAFLAQDARLFLPLGVLSFVAMLLAHPSAENFTAPRATPSPR